MKKLALLIAIAIASGTLAFFLGFKKDAIQSHHKGNTFIQCDGDDYRIQLLSFDDTFHKKEAVDIIEEIAEIQEDDAWELLEHTPSYYMKDLSLSEGQGIIKELSDYGVKAKLVPSESCQSKHSQNVNED